MKSAFLSDAVTLQGFNLKHLRPEEIVTEQETSERNVRADPGQPKHSYTAYSYTHTQTHTHTRKHRETV